MRYSLATVTEPTAAVVSPADIERYARLVDVSAEIDHITDLIAAATKQCERWSERQFVHATYRMQLPEFPACEEIYLPKPPLSSVTHVKYYDTANTLQTFTSSYYHVDTDSQPGRIVLALGQAWPATYERPDAVQLTFVAGYGAAGTATPANVRLAVKMLVKTWYDNPDMYVVGMGVNELPANVMAILGGETIPVVL